MSFLRDKRARRDRRRFLIGVAALGLFVFVFLVVGSRPLVATGYRIATPFWELQYQLRDRLETTTNLALIPKKDLLAEVERLEMEAAAREVGLARLAVLERENRTLRTALDAVWEEESWLVAGVLVAPPKTPYDILVLDVGRKHDVASGSLVFSYGGVVLGVVQEVLQHQSVVGLLSTPGIETDVVLEKQGIGVVARGIGGGVFEIRVPREIEAAEGDAVVLPGRQTEIVGVVQEIIFDPRDPFQRVLASAPGSFYEQRFVYVSDRVIKDIPQIETVVIDEGAATSTLDNDVDDPTDMIEDTDDE